jgi:hypothetical protein
MLLVALVLSAAPSTLLVEEQVPFALSLAKRIYFMGKGCINRCDPARALKAIRIFLKDTWVWGQVEPSTSCRRKAGQGAFAIKSSGCPIFTPVIKTLNHKPPSL